MSVRFVSNILSWNQLHRHNPPPAKMPYHPEGTRLFSQIEPSKEISVNIWAVSMLVEKGEGSMGLADLLSFHTVLIIEGVEREAINYEFQIRQFWQKTHLRGPSTLADLRAWNDCYSGHSNIGKIETSEKKFTAFSMSKFKKFRQTWTVPQQTVNRMLEQIELEQQNQTEIYFRLLGKNSIFSVERHIVKVDRNALLSRFNNDIKNSRLSCEVLLIQEERNYQTSIGRSGSDSRYLSCYFEKRSFESF